METSLRAENGAGDGWKVIFSVLLETAARAVQRIPSARAHFGCWEFYLFAAALPSIPLAAGCSATIMAVNCNYCSQGGGRGFIVGAEH